jgi:septal ring factor EnvC (AmiA/AmiB activator)
MTHRTLLGLGVATLLLAAPTACSDDDSSDVCATLDSLNASIDDVTDVDDVDQDTLTELEDEVGDVRTDLEELRSEASDEYSDEIDAVSEASTNLGTSLDAARATPSSSTMADVVTASQALATAVRNLGDALKDTC